MKAKSYRQTLPKRLLTTSTFLGIFLIGKKIPLPYLDKYVIDKTFNTTSNTSFSFLTNNSEFSLFALNVYPVLNATLILQFLIAVIPSLEKLQREEGEFGQNELDKIKKVLTLLISTIQAINLILTYNKFISQKFITALLLITGGMIISWISDVITKKGIVTGPSLLLLVNIINDPKLINDIETKFLNLTTVDQLVNLLSFYLVSFTILMLLNAKIEIPIITSKQLLAAESEFLESGAISANLNQGGSIPLKLNQGGILPVALATGASVILKSIFSNNKIINLILPIFLNVLIVLLNVFYTTFLWDPKKISDELKKVSAIIPTLDPGEITEEYLQKIVKKYSLIGGILLSLIIILPTLLRPLIYPKYYIFDSLNISSLILVLGVGIEILKNLKSLAS